MMVMPGNLTCTCSPHSPVALASLIGSSTCCIQQYGMCGKCSFSFPSFPAIFLLPCYPSAYNFPVALLSIRLQFPCYSVVHRLTIYNVFWYLWHTHTHTYIYKFLRNENGNTCIYICIHYESGTGDFLSGCSFTLSWLCNKFLGNCC